MFRPVVSNFDPSSEPFVGNTASIPKQFPWVKLIEKLTELKRSYKIKEFDLSLKLSVFYVIGHSLTAIYTQLINKREYPLRAIMDHAG